MKTAMQSNYAKKLLDPRWQRRKTEILQRDDFTCQDCSGRDETLHVHHKYYTWGKQPWEYPDSALITLCETCHKRRHAKNPTTKIAISPIAKATDKPIDETFIAGPLGFQEICGGQHNEEERTICGQTFMTEWIRVFRGPEIQSSDECLVIHMYSYIDDRFFLLKTNTPAYDKGLEGGQHWWEPEWVCDEIKELKTQQEAIEAVRLHAK